METISQLKVIARIRSDFSHKFGIPRQSGLVDGLTARVVFEPGYREKEALRGMEGYSHLWLLWYFSENGREARSLTVRPPRLGGNKRMGVFATRSPFRPNPIGLSCVRLLGMEDTAEGTVLVVEGADLLDRTPVLDIKPYLPFTDCRPEAVGGFAAEEFDRQLTVHWPDSGTVGLTDEQKAALTGIFQGDPRPAYQNDPSRVYRMEFAGFTLSFTVDGEELWVQSISSETNNQLGVL